MAAIRAAFTGLNWLANNARLRVLESIYAAINKSQAVIEMDMDGTVLAANDSYLKMFGYSLAEIRGQPYTVFVDPADRGGAEYRSLWEHMHAGQFEQGRFKRMGKGGREVWVRASFNPLIGEHGKPWRVIKFASEITPIILEARAFDSAVHESQDVIQAALSGAGDRRIGLTGKSGNLERLTRSINQLIGSVSTTVAETMQVVQRAVDGDLTTRVNVDDKSGHFKGARGVGQFDDPIDDGGHHAFDDHRPGSETRRGGNLARQPRVEQAHRRAGREPGKAETALVARADDLNRQEQRG